MERRSFMQTVALGASAAGGAVWLPGCGAAGAPTTLARAETDALLERLRRGLGVRRAARSQREQVVALGLESLVVADVARSIPAGARLTEPLAAKLRETLPMLDECVVTYHALLEEAPRAMRRELDRKLRSKPDLAMDVAEVLDERARDVGISYDSRVRLRRIAAHVGTRIRRQSAGALIDDCVAKVDGVVARSGGDVRAARGAWTAAMIQGIWQQVEGTTGAGTTLQSPAASPLPVERSTLYYGAPEAPPAPQGGAGDPELAVGGVMLGAGLAVFGIAGIVGLAMQNAFPLAVVATPAGVAVIIGIILLIIGGVQNA